MTLGIILISFLAGIAASMGLGGGTFLIIYLTAFAGMAQISAQGINLIFFIPASAAALWLHSRNGLVEWRKILPAVVAGTVTAVAAALIANRINPEWSRRLFGAFILIAGMRMLASRKKQ